MGHKVHPTGIRLGISKDWNSKWYAGKKEYAGYLAADLKVREMLRKKLASAGISRITIERPAKTARVTSHTAPPGGVTRSEERRGGKEWVGTGRSRWGA